MQSMVSISGSLYQLAVVLNILTTKLGLPFKGIFLKRYFVKIWKIIFMPDFIIIAICSIICVKVPNHFNKISKYIKTWQFNIWFYWLLQNSYFSNEIFHHDQMKCQVMLWVYWMVNIYLTIIPGFSSIHALSPMNFIKPHFYILSKINN